MDYSRSKRQAALALQRPPLFNPQTVKENSMQAPFTVTITVNDAEGKKIQLLEQCELDYETLVAVQKAVSEAFVGLGQAGVALRKSQAK